MGNVNCCKNDMSQEAREEIFALAPDDIKIPASNNLSEIDGGEEPRDVKEPEDNYNLNTGDIVIEQNQPIPQYQDYQQPIKSSYKPYENEIKPQEEEPKDEEPQDNNIPYENQPIDENPVEEEPQVNADDILEKLRSNYQEPIRDDFTENDQLEGWKKFYEPDERFFLFDKGTDTVNKTIVNGTEQDDNLEVYQGDVNPENQKHGFGKETTKDKIRIGTWRRDEFTGWNREVKPNGDVYEGKYVSGELNGKAVIDQPGKGTSYTGDMENGRKNGRGEYNSGKVRYEGEFTDGKMNGKGQIEFKNEGHSYKGDFLNNQITGNGEFTWQNGDVYIGELKNGKMDGEGRYIYKVPEGQIYEGHFENGYKNGQGKITYPNGKTYEGEFVNGKPNGSGMLKSSIYQSRVMIDDSGNVTKQE